MNCRIIYKDNKIDHVQAENGERSILFDSLKDIFGAEKALELYALTEEDGYKQKIQEKVRSFVGVTEKQIDKLSEVIDAQETLNKLVETGLADNIYQMTSEEIEAKLVELGVEADMARQVVAYHGSPYSFNRFTTNAMGTGEGAQAFGWGLYFTDLESIARMYADKLSDLKVGDINFSTILENSINYSSGKEKIIKTYNILKQKALDNGTPIKDFKTMKSFIESDYLYEWTNGVFAKNKLNKEIGSVDGFYSFTSDILDIAKQNKTKLKSSKNLYKVSLHKGKTPSEYTWLEWDKPVSDEVKNKVTPVILKDVKDKYIVVTDEYNNYFVEDKSGYRYSTAYSEKVFAEEYIEDEINKKLQNGEKIYNSLVSLLGGQKEVSLFLLENGIDGVKYPAESISRGATSDTARGFNYVVFDENAITIEEQIQFQKSTAAQQAEPKGYYSNAQESFTNLKDKNVKNVQGWMKALTDTQKNGGIKNVNQELEWIGLEDYLNEYVKENNPKAGNIPSSVVEDYIKSNQIEIVDVSKGISPSEKEIEDAGFTIKEDVFGGVTLELEGNSVTSDSDKRLNNYQKDLVKRYYGASPTKYSGYQLKGGENYREVLLTMPAKTIENDKIFTVKNRRDFWKDLSNFSAQEVEEGFVVSSVRGGRQLIEKDYYIKTKEDAINYYREDNLQLLDIFNEEQGVEYYDFYDEDGQYFNTTTAPNMGQAISEYKSQTSKKEDEYKSSHWSEKNVLAHVRLNEKTLPDGRKVLILNEIQADISQDLKKEQDKILDRVDKEFDNFLDNLIRNNVIIEEC